MIRSLWYFLKVLVVIGVAVFLATQPGVVRIEWKEYVLTGHLGFLLVAILAIFLLTVAVSGLAFRITSWPREFFRYRQNRRRTKGYQALIRSMVAAAAGDQKNSYYLAHRAQKLLPPEESGIPLLLQAHAAKGEDESMTAYRALLGNAETALLGMQGLMQKSILQGDFPAALVLAREAVKSQPRSDALLRTVYDLEIKNHVWNDALHTLERARAKGIISKEEARKDRKVIFLILGDMARVAGRLEEAIDFYKKSVREDSFFVPAVSRLARHYLDQGSRFRALYLIKKAWKAGPHPEYLPIWDLLVPEAKANQGATRYRWFEWILEFHPDYLEAVLALARVAVEEGLWGEARSALMKAEKIRPSRSVYQTWILLEEKTTNKPDVVRQWMDRAAHALPDGVWVCSKTGRKFPAWIPVVEPEGAFNSLVWIDRPPEETSLTEVASWLKPAGA